MPETPSALAAAPTGSEQQAGSLPAYGGTSSKALNPDIGMIGNFLGAVGSSKGSDSVAPFPSLTLQESEASFQAIVDPYARADFFLAIGEEGIEVEEGYVSFPTVPGGLLIKAGKMRANFGRLNAFHNHTLPWVDRPLVMFNLLGGATDDPDKGWSKREAPSGPQHAFGGFVSTDYRLDRRWFFGGRYDWSDRARQATVRDTGFSLVATFWPSEFTQLRGQYRRTRFGDGATANEFLFQTLFTIGAHGAHPF